MTAVLAVTAECHSGCGVLASGTTADPPGGRYQTRWSEVDAAAVRHVAETGHATSSSARPA